MDENLLWKLETDLHRPEVRTSRPQVEALLADEFREFGSSGRVWDKDAIIASLLEESPTGADLPQVSEKHVTVLAPDCVLLTYLSVRTVPLRKTLRSSIWKCREGKWQMVFHQGTISAESRE